MERHLDGRRLSYYVNGLLHPPHGSPARIRDDDIEHAISYRPFRQEYDDGARILYLGPDRASNMLEVLTIREDDDELVIHAMRMQSKYDHVLTHEEQNDD